MGNWVLQTLQGEQISKQNSKPGSAGLSRITDRSPRQRCGSSGCRCRRRVTGGNLWKGRTLGTAGQGDPLMLQIHMYHRLGCVCTLIRYCRRKGRPCTGCRPVPGLWAFQGTALVAHAPACRVHTRVNMCARQRRAWCRRLSACGRRAWFGDQRSAISSQPSRRGEREHL